MNDEKEFFGFIVKGWVLYTVLGVLTILIGFSLFMALGPLSKKVEREIIKSGPGYNEAITGEMLKEIKEYSSLDVSIAENKDNITLVNAYQTQQRAIVNLFNDNYAKLLPNERDNLPENIKQFYKDHQ